MTRGTGTGPPRNEPVLADLTVGTGELGRAVAALDWSASPIGRPATWSAALRSVVSILLTSRFSMWMGWGPDLTVFYNDAYRRDTLGVKHPWALGRPAHEVWAEIWPDIGPRIDSVLGSGEATWDEGLLLLLERAGYTEETYHTFSYSPLRDGGAVAGFLCVVSEDTERVLGERRLRVLGELGDISAVTSPTVERACADALAVLARDRLDIPFASVYLPDGEQARREGFYGTSADPRAVPARVDRASATAVWKVLDTGVAQVVDELPVGDGFYDPVGPAPMHDHAPHTAVVLPLAGSGGGAPLGVLVAGVSPYRALDEEYRRFLDLVADQVSNAVVDARALQAQARRADELAELDRVKTEFFTGVSHELRTPLTLITGPAEDGLADAAHPLAPEQRERLEVIVRNSGRLRRLVDTLLEFSQLEEGRLVADRVPVDLALLTRGVVESFAPAVDRVGLALEIDCPPLPSAVAVDTDMWEKIVLNLLSNAVKYTLDGGVRVSLRRGADGSTTLVVADTGVGIAAAELPLLFQRFHRVRGVTGRSHEGSGIGLALVAELAGLHGAAATVESEPGRGSTFTVTLPPAARTRAPAVPPTTSGNAQRYRDEALQWGAPAQDAEQAAASAPPGAATVLVAEDNRDLLRFVTGLLAPHYTVLEAVDGVAALDLARRHRPDLVLTDVMMPRLDGFALLSALRADPATATIPVVVLSARAGEEAAGEGLAAGADDYLVKPFSRHDLLARVRSNLAMARLRSSEAAYRSAIVDSLLDGLYVVDAAGDVVEVNPAFTRTLGYGPEGLPYHLPHPWWPDPEQDPAGVEQVQAAMAAVQDSGRGRYLLPLRHRDGRRIWGDCSATTMPAIDGSGPVIVGVVRDVTAEHRAAVRDGLLAAVGQVLAHSTTLQHQLADITRLVSEAFAARADVVLTSPDPTAAHPAELVAALRQRPAAAEPFLAGGVLVAPLVVMGRRLGALTVDPGGSGTFGGPGRSAAFGGADFATVAELARRVAVAVDAARAAEREGRLHEVTVALAAAGTAAEAADALATSLHSVLAASGVAVYAPDPDDESSLHLVHSSGFPDGVGTAFVAVSLGADAPVADAARWGVAVWLHDQDEWHAAHPGLVHQGVSAADIGHAVAAVPMEVQGELAGVLALGFPTEREFPADERTFILTLAAQAAQALARAGVADARRRVAETLQEALLPSRLPAHPRLAVATRYLPAGRHNAAGGDWYDVAVLDDDHIAVSVGDVVGHGAGAAAVMGQLRSALSAALLNGRPPADALAALSRFATTVEGARGSTAICLVLHTGTGEMAWARSGHLPPLVVDPGGKARFLEDATGVLLGVTGTAAPTEGRARLDPGATVLLYTDGLVERRSEVIDDGFDRLAAAASAACDLPPAHLVPAVLRAALPDDEQPADDIAVVAVRLLPAPLDERRPAEPAELAVLRRTVRQWGERSAMDPERLDDLQLLLGEAVANAVEHAYLGRPPGTFRYRLEHDGRGGVTGLVADEGHWRPAPEPGNRGRGLLMVRGLGRDVSVDGTPGGTTVRFTLPAGDGTPADRPGGGPDDPRGGGGPGTAGVDVEPSGTGVRVRLRGDLDVSTVPGLRPRFLQAVSGSDGPVEVDLREVGYLASAGVLLLLEAATSATALRLSTLPGSPSERVLRLTGLSGLLGRTVAAQPVPGPA